MTPTPFFICGLPRSRTTWLAQFFTVAPVVRCFHDLAGHAASVEQMARLLTPANNTLDSQLAAIGSSCSGQAMLFDKFLPLIPRTPQPKFIYVRRDFREALNSFVKVTQLDGETCLGAFMRVWAFLRSAELENPGMSVRFEDLDSEETMRALWKHILPEHPFPEEHYRGLRGVNIQPDPAQLRADIASGRRCAFHEVFSPQPP